MLGVLFLSWMASVVFVCLLEGLVGFSFPAENLKRSFLVVGDDSVPVFSYQDLD